MLASRPQIFISYARTDARFVEQLERILLEWNCQPWIDRRQLAGGQIWRQELASAIERSGAVILVLTRDALKSPVVRQEYMHALAQHIPVALAQFGPIDALPTELVALPLIDFRRTRWHSPLLTFQKLFFTLADYQVFPSEPDDSFEVHSPFTFIQVNGGRSPTGWHVYRARREAYISLTLSNLLPLFIGLIMQDFVTPPQSPLFVIYLLRSLWFLVSVVLLIVSLLIFPRAFLAATIFLNAPSTGDVVVVTPIRCAIRIYHFAFFRGYPRSGTYPYASLQSIAIERGNFGQVALLLTGKRGETKRIDLPRRFPHRLAIAQSLRDAFAIYQQKHSEASTLPHEPVAPLPSSALVAAAVPANRFYCLVAAAADQSLLAAIQPWLAYRGYTAAPSAWQGDLLLPLADTPAQASFALVCASPSVYQSPTGRAIISDLRRRDLRVLPIRTQLLPVLPAELDGLQWIDFSPERDRAASFLDLCDALDHVGIPIELRGVPFDGELALARAIHNHAPASWRVGQPHEAATRIYRSQRVTRSPVLLGILAALAAITVLDFLGGISGITTTVQLLLLSAWIVTLIWLFTPLLPRGGRVNSRNQFFTRFAAGYYAPECFVATPTGVAFHVIDSLNARFIDGAVAFRDLTDIRFETAWSGALRLRFTPRGGAPFSVDFPFFIASEQSFHEAVALFKAFTHAEQLPMSAVGEE